MGSSQLLHKGCCQQAQGQAGCAVAGSTATAPKHPRPTPTLPPPEAAPRVGLGKAPHGPDAELISTGSPKNILGASGLVAAVQQTLLC